MFGFSDDEFELACVCIFEKARVYDQTSYPTFLVEDFDWFGKPIHCKLVEYEYDSIWELAAGQQCLLLFSVNCHSMPFLTAFLLVCVTINEWGDGAHYF